MQALYFFAHGLQNCAVFGECAHAVKGVSHNNDVNMGLCAHVLIWESGLMFRRSAMSGMEMRLILYLQLRRIEPLGEFFLDCLG